MVRCLESRSFHRIVPVAAILFLSAFGQANGQASRSEKYFGDWSVLCLEDAKGVKQCNMIQARLRGSPALVVFRWVVAPDKDKRILSVLQTPYGVALKEGLQVTPADESSIRLAYRICGPQWCEARLSFDQAWEKRLREKAISIRYVDGQGQEVKTEITKNGFGEALSFFKGQVK
jgi:invasion protein IalB